jgi:hypothetical protein
MFFQERDSGRNLFETLAERNAVAREFVRSQLSACYLPLIGKDQAFATLTGKS